MELDSEPWEISLETQRTIDDHWETLMTAGKTFTRGISYAVASIVESSEGLTIHVRQTDYAHYVASVHGAIHREWCRVIYSAGAVITADGHVAIGRMAPWTTWAGRWQLCAGGLIRDDLIGNTFDMEASLRREMGEELGLEASAVLHLKPLWLKSGGPFDFLTLIYAVRVAYHHDDFLQRYADFVRKCVAQGIPSEFSEVALLPLNRTAVAQWLTEAASDEMVDYLAEALQRLADSDVECIESKET